MKKSFLAALAAVCICLVACYDVNEEITINENGSGHYATRIDMSALLELMQQFGGQSDSAMKTLDRTIDTTISFRNVVDSAKKLTADEQALMQSGMMHMVMNLKEKKFKIDMDFDFHNAHELEILLSGAGTGNFGDALKNVFKQDANSETQLDAPKDLEVDQLSNIYEVKVDKKSISKKIDRAKLDAMLKRPEMEQLNQMGATGMEILYTTTIVLPRPLKNNTNSSIKVSDDRKRLTIRNNLMDVFVKPEMFEFVIEY